MDQRLQQAIDAARAGETAVAQRLLTEVLKADPEETHAWFLLSHLVDSQQKQVAYLGKVLALDPAHAQARQRLAYVRSGAAGGAARRLPDAAMDVTAQADSDTVPEWMADAGGAFAAAAVEAPRAAEPTPAEELPDWLQQPVGEAWQAGGAQAAMQTAAETAAAETAAAAAASTGAAAAKKPQPAAAKPARAARPAAGKRPAAQRWNLLLVILVVITAVVAYLLVQALLAL